jgi:hypothetical protein
MNNTFNLHRFNLLLKRQWLEFGKIFLITLLVALGVFVAFYGVTLLPLRELTDMPYRLRFREPLYLMFGFLFVSVIASSYFAHLGQKPKAIIDLLIPASILEKFLAGVFFTSILSTLSFTILFYITDFAFISYIKTYFQSSGNVEEIERIKGFLAQNDFRNFIPFYAMPFAVTSLFMLGSIFFNRFHYIKTTISIMLFISILVYIFSKTSEILFSGKTSISIENNQGKDFFEWMALIFLLIFTLITWTISYVRLKEKEV